MTGHLTRRKIVPVVLSCSVCLAFVGCILPSDQLLFSFVVIADPHVDGPHSQNKDNLERCVGWINEHFDDSDKGIEMVFVVGDLGGDYGRTTKGILDNLDPNVPYFPLIGDNDTHWSRGGEGDNRYFTGDERFEETFGGVFDGLSSRMENWQKAPTPVWNPEIVAESRFQNLSFDHKGVHFLCLDWCVRKDKSTTENPLQSEQADLHNFEGGTFPWFKADISSSAGDTAENIVMLSHHPMHVAPIIGGWQVNLGAFDHAELDKIETFTASYANSVYADIAGHYHVDLFEKRSAGGYNIFMTWAVHWEPNAFMKLVRVYHDEITNKIKYDHKYILVPADETVPAQN